MEEMSLGVGFIYILVPLPSSASSSPMQCDWPVSRSGHHAFRTIMDGLLLEL